MESYSELPFCKDLHHYSRRKTVEVNIGGVPMGGSNPIRVQSMTTVDTMDTEGSIEECIRMINSGCEYIRITAPSIKEAENLANIKNGLKKRGYEIPLVADIHFTPNAAEVAAKIVEKVRINPGNYADKKKFDVIEYSDEQYQEEIQRIKEKFTPLVEICKVHGTAMRIGTNHGSLSDRIMSRYGDTPFGMVESAMEFLRICEELEYYNIVLSMKSSNPQVMVQAYRLLVATLEKEKMKPYPLHLGVTEAGEGEDGRIKSAMGIGTLLEDGLGDTVRVSLTEDPEFEAPVAKKLVDRYTFFDKEFEKEQVLINTKYKPYEYKKIKSNEVGEFGSDKLPKVIADFSNTKLTSNKQLKAIGHHYLSATDKWTSTDTAADFIYLGKHVPLIAIHSNLPVLCDVEILDQISDENTRIPVLTVNNFENYSGIKGLKISPEEIDSELIDKLKKSENLFLILQSSSDLNYKTLRETAFRLKSEGVRTPVILSAIYSQLDHETFQLHASTDLGGLFIDGFGDGIMLNAGQAEEQLSCANSVAFGVLQAARVRMSKTEYISCPSCGRTLFDLQETTAMIRSRTDHLKGVKIGIMGCIVNGPGEMADADYGYVGSGVGKITLYKGQEVIKRGVPSENAVDELIEIIKEGGSWIDPQEVNQEVL